MSRLKSKKAQPKTSPTLKPMWQNCVDEIGADKSLTYLQRGVATLYLLERTNYIPPINATEEEAARVLVSAAKAEAHLWYPNGITKQEAEERTILQNFILAPNDKPMKAPPWEMTREEWTNFFRSVEQARQTYMGQYKSLQPPIFHQKFRSAFIPALDLLLIHRWISPDPKCVSLAHCTGEVACEILSAFSEAGHDPKNFTRKKRQLGLKAYSKAEIRAHSLR